MTFPPMWHKPPPATYDNNGTIADATGGAIHGTACHWGHREACCCTPPTLWSHSAFHLKPPLLMLLCGQGGDQQCQGAITPPVHRSHHPRRAGGRGGDRAKAPSLLYLVALNPLALPPPLLPLPSPSHSREGGDSQPQGTIVALNSLPALHKKNKGGNQPRQGAIVALNPLLPSSLLSYSSSSKAKNQTSPTKSSSGGGSMLRPTQNQQKLTSPFPSSSPHPPLSQGHPPGTYPCIFNARIMTNLESE